MVGEDATVVIAGSVGGGLQKGRKKSHLHCCWGKQVVLVYHNGLYT